MADKVKTAAEKALERHTAKVADGEVPEHVTELPSGERKEYDVDNFKITPQEKAPTHVVNQDEATGFDVDKQSGRFEDDKQSFTRIKNVYAEGPEVVIEVDPKQTDFRIHAAVLQTQRLSVQEAIQRAVALNQMLMLDKINLSDRKQVGDIVEATIEAVLEAKENMMRSNGATYEDIKKSRQAQLDRIHMFEKAVHDKRGKAELDKLQEFMMFKRVLERVNK